ncbi:hypothetical protein V8E55_003278 [Tylopilus felleus]
MAKSSTTTSAWNGVCSFDMPERPDEEVNTNTTSLVFIPAVDNCIEYDHQSSLSNHFPEYHGHFKDNITFVSIFCPWYIHDSKLSPQERMTQIQMTSKKKQSLLQLLGTSELESGMDDDPMCAMMVKCGEYYKYFKDM